MELWVRSQDKRHLIKANYVSIMENNIINVASSGWDYDVAKYKSKERALEVLDEIESVMKTNCGFELYSRTGVYPNEFNKKWNCVPVYQMPES